MKNQNSNANTLDEPSRRLEHLNRVLKAIRNVNQLIVQSEDRESLLQGACDCLTETMGYFNAWIALLDDDRKLIASYHSGLDESFGPMVERLKTGKLTRCALKILDGKHILSIEEPETVCVDCPLASSYKGRGAMTAGLMYQDHVYGVLSVSVPREFARDTEERDLLAEVAGDIGFALHKFDLEDEHSSVQKSIRLYRDIIFTCEDPMVYIGQDYRLVEVNDAYASYIGLTPDKLSGKRLSELNEEKVFAERLKPFIDRCLSGQDVFFEFEREFPGKGLRQVQIHFWPHKNEDGEIMGVFGIGHDVTESREQEREARAVLATVGDGFWRVDTDGRIIEVNDAAVNMLGYSREELINLCITDLDVDLSPKQVRDRIRIIQREGYKRFETRQRRKDGRVIDLEVSTTYLPQQGGQLVAFLHDITEQKQREEELRKARELSDRIIEDGPVAITQVDCEGKIVHANNHAELLLGLETSDLDGVVYNSPDWQITAVDGSLFPEDRLPFNQIMATGKSVYDVRHAITTSDGTRKILSINGAPLHDEHGRIERIVFAIQDITLREEHEEHLRKIAWMLEKEEAVDTSPPQTPFYGDVTELNTERTIRDSVGLEVLQAISNDMMTLLDTSLAIYEKNGDYAYGTFVSEWCSIMDGASRRLCHTEDNKEALSCGCWLCHETCWNESARAAMESGEPTDIGCVGGIRMYAVPIYANDEVVGAINFGYGNPPTDDLTLSRLADQFETDIEVLRRSALAFKPRPPFVVEAAKARLQIVARQIGQMVENRRAQDALRENQRWLNETTKIARVGGWKIDFLGNTVEWTDETFRIYELPIGVPPNVDESILFYHPDDRSRVSAAVQNAVENGEDFSFEARLITAKQNLVWVNAIGHVNLQDGRASSVWGTVQDITELHKNRQELIERSNMIEQAIDSIVGTDLEFRITYMNQSAEKLFGWTLEEIKGKPADLFNAEPALAEIQAEIYRTISEGGEYTGEALNRRKDGSTFICQFKVSPITDHNGTIISYMGIQRDVTEQKQAERTLRESELRYKRLSENSPAVVYQFRMDTDGSFSFPFVTSSVQKIMGISAEVVMQDASSLLDKIHPSQREDFEKAVFQSAREMSDYNQELMLLKDADVCWIEASSVPERQNDGSVLWDGFLVDITEKKSAELALRRSETLLGKVLDLTPVYICAKNLDGRFLLVNQKLADFYGRSVEELRGMLHAEICEDQEELAKMLSADRTVMESGRPLHIPEETMAHPDGSLMVLETHKIPFIVDDEPAVLIVASDITERRQLEERLRHSEKMDAVGHLAGGMAHDFNNQLAGILGYGDMLAKRLDDPDMRRYAENICTAARRSADLTKKLLAFSRKGQFQCMPVDMHKVIHETVDMLHHSIDKRIRIRQDLNAQETTVNGDPSQIQNALLNLAINAADAMPEGGALTFATHVRELNDSVGMVQGFDVPAGRYVLVSVADTGSGIPSDVLEHVFEPFYTTKKPGKGTGMGLASVYGCVQQHNGCITVDSTVDEGTCFNVCLPLVESAAKDEAESRDSPELAQVMRILLVDDEEIVRNLGYDVLSTAGHTVLSAADGREAVDLYREKWQDIDLVVLDMVMPEMGGRDAFREMKKINPRIKAVLASGYSLNEDSQAILAEGVLGFVQKPFDQMQISQAIQHALRAEPLES